MRYTGSKNRLAGHLLPIFQEAFKVYPNGAYIEPFVGGANMIMHVNHPIRVGYDYNKHLIALLREAQAESQKLINSECYSKAAFKYVKANMENYQDWYVGAVGFLPTYCNMWMKSYVGHLRPKQFESAKNSLLKHDMSGIHFLQSDYRDITIGKGNVIYCDPPYKHYDYYKMPFIHSEFCDWVRNASRDNIVFVSEYEMPTDFECVWKKTIKPGINPKAQPREEKLFMYKY
jgi:DNA adenine methylase